MTWYLSQVLPCGCCKSHHWGYSGTEAVGPGADEAGHAAVHRVGGEPVAGFRVPTASLLCPHQEEPLKTDAQLLSPGGCRLRHLQLVSDLLLLYRMQNTKENQSQSLCKFNWNLLEYTKNISAYFPRM